jgi:hypothetical protein
MFLFSHFTLEELSPSVSDNGGSGGGMKVRTVSPVTELVTEVPSRCFRFGDAMLIL